MKDTILQKKYRMHKFGWFVTACAAVSLGLVAQGATCTYTDGEWDSEPTSADDEINIVSGDLTWDSSLPAKVASWTQTGGTVTFQTVFPGQGDFELFEVAGDVSLTGGTWTHAANSANEKEYRLCVDVAGSMVIGPDATIHADGCGYTMTGGGGHPKANGTSGGCYGGHGDLNTATVNYTYGSYAAPADDLGGGGSWSSIELPGGGAIKISVSGDLTHNGSIHANGLYTLYKTNPAYYLGAGGGIELVAGSIAGVGTIKANSPSANNTGGGGRIAVKLTKAGADFSNYDILNLAEAVAERAKTGGPGTIYAETAADQPGEGWLIMKGNGSDPQAKADIANGDPFPHGEASIHVSKLTLTNQVTLVVRADHTLDLSGTKSVAADVPGRNNAIRLDGGRVVFVGDEQSEAKIGCPINCLTEPEISTGSIVCEAWGNLVLTKNFSYDGDIVLDGGSLIAQGNLTVSGDVTVKAGGVFCTDALTFVDGAFEVENGGLVTCEGPSDTTALMKRLDLHVSGDVWVKSGGVVDVTGKGYSKGKAPEGRVGSGNGGASHGGLGSRNGGVYGSIYAPALAGAGSSHSAGGGIATIVVDGAFVNDGVVRASGELNYYHGGGGSISITAKTLSGTGIVDARAGADEASNASVAGGGRIAVTLTDPQADYSSFPLERFLAAGDLSGKNAGGAGTVYLRTGAQLADEGTLYVCNAPKSTTTTFYETILADGVVEGTAFGTVIITNSAKVKLAEGGIIKVKGDWLNYASFTAGTGSAVEFAGGGTVRVVGNTTFASVSCIAGGKRIEIAPGTTLTVSEAMSLAGTASSKIELVCSEPDGTWNLVNNGQTAMVGVKLAGCQATNPITVMNGEDGGNNSSNITIVKIEPGEEIVWLGSASALWSEAANWDRQRVPIDTDNVIVRTGGQALSLDVGASVASLTIDAGASLNVGNRALAVSDDFVQNGSLTVGAGGAVSAGGDVTLAGVCALSGSALTLNGGTAQTLTVAAGISLPIVRSLSTALTVASSLDCEEFVVGDGETACAVAFAAGTTLTTKRFDVHGAAGKLAVLAGKDDGVWNLNTSRADVEWAHVTGSDASSGILILPKNSTDGGNNRNWMFEDKRVHWDGVSPTTIDDDVVIDADSDFAISAPREMKSLTVSGNATLTVNDSLTVAGSVTLESAAALVWNRHGTIGGNLTMLSGSVLTHSPNADQEINKISLDIGGSGIIQQGAMIDVKGKGFTTGRGPGSVGGNVAGSYGGRGYYNNSPVAAAPCYGSYVCPTNCGSGGGEAANVNRSSVAGGAVRLAFGGDLALAGNVCADGQAESVDGWYTGTGGSVWIVARALSGSGDITADGGNGSMSRFGAGGRISLCLTGAGAGFAAYAGRVHAWGGSHSDLSIPSFCSGSAGTVYRKTADDNGIVCLSNNPKITGQRVDSQDFTDFPSEALCDPNELLNRDVVLESYATLNLTRNYSIRSLMVNDATPRILLNGHVLRLENRPTRAMRKVILEVTVPGQDEKGNPGKIMWNKGLVISVQ